MRKLLFMVLLFAACAVARAQNSDLGILIGPTYTGSTFRFGAQINYARQFWERPAGRLYVEVPLIIPASENGEANPLRLFITPGIRYHFNVSQRIVLYAAGGFGVATIPRSTRNSGAFAYGGGLDFRLTRRWSIRGDLRNITTTSKVLVTGRNSPSVMAGIALHF